jgi:hypothetical protein
MISLYQKRLKTKVVLDSVFAASRGLKNKEVPRMSHKRPFVRRKAVPVLAFAPQAAADAFEDIIRNRLFGGMGSR